MLVYLGKELLKRFVGQPDVISLPNSENVTL